MLLFAERQHRVGCEASDTDTVYRVAPQKVQFKMLDF